MTPDCTCTFDSYSRSCPRVLHVAWALRDIPSPRQPLAMSSPCPDEIPAWVLEETA